MNNAEKLEIKGIDNKGLWVYNKGIVYRLSKGRFTGERQHKAEL